MDGFRGYRGGMFRLAQTSFHGPIAGLKKRLNKQRGSEYLRLNWQRKKKWPTAWSSALGERELRSLKRKKFVQAFWSLEELWEDR